MRCPLRRWHVNQSRPRAVFAAAWLLVLSSALAFVPERAAAKDLHLKINAGGPAIAEWSADASLALGGAGYEFGGEHDTSGVENPAPPEVYQSVRHQNHDYNFPQLPNGDYLVRIHFTEGYSKKDRRMHYRIEGREVLKDFDVEAAASGTFKAVVKEFPVTVADGNGLQIQCSQGAGTDVFEAALEIIGQNLDLPAGAAELEVAMAKKPPAPAKPSSKLSSEKATPLRALTGAPTRVVWTQSELPGDFCILHKDHAWLYGYDSEDPGAGERRILEEKKGYVKPLFTPDGQRIVFTTRDDEKCFVINWDGSGLREISPGIASDIWRDPASGQDWVYLRTAVNSEKAQIIRVLLDNPAVREPVFDSGPVGQDWLPWFQLSADGRRATDTFPWPTSGILNLDTGKWAKTENGCWTGMAPDNSYRFWVFSGTHEQISLYDYGGANRRVIRLNTMPEVGGQKVYHPQWSNHPRYFTVTGPKATAASEIYVGRFDEKFETVEQWVRVTRNKRGDFYGDTWIDYDSAADRSFQAQAPSAVTPASEGSWPRDSSGLVFLWVNGFQRNTFPDLDGKGDTEARVALRGRAHLNRFYAATLTGGALETENDAQALVESFRDSDDFTLGFWIKPENPDADDWVTLAQYGDRNFRVRAKGDQVAIEVLAGGEIERLELDIPDQWLEPAEPPVFVTFTFGNRQLKGYLDGRSTKKHGVDSPSLNNWEPRRLVFGDGRWKGAIEGIVLYDQTLDDDAIDALAKAYKPRFAERTPLPPLVVKAKLLSSAPYPSSESIQPYSRALVEHHYQIESVVEGSLDAKELVATRWTILDRQPVGEERKPGQSYTLRLEPIESHPELSGEFRESLNDVDFSLPLFHDVGPVGE